MTQRTRALGVTLLGLALVLAPLNAAVKKPLDTVDVVTLLAAGIPNQRVAAIIRERGISFEPDKRFLDAVSLSGGDEEVLGALRSARRTEPAKSDYAPRSGESGLTQRFNRAIAFLDLKAYPQAERELRGGLQPPPDNETASQIHKLLAGICRMQKKYDDAIGELGQSLRLSPNDPEAYSLMGQILWDRHDYNGAIAQYRKVVSLEPDSSLAHTDLGFALRSKAELGPLIDSWLGESHAVQNQQEVQALQDEALNEYREAVRLDGQNAEAHCFLCQSLMERSKTDAALLECREAVRLRPEDAQFHLSLGLAFRAKGDLNAASEEIRTAHSLAPNDSTIDIMYRTLRKP